MTGSRCRQEVELEQSKAGGDRARAALGEEFKRRHGGARAETKREVVWWRQEGGAYVDYGEEEHGRSWGEEKAQAESGADGAQSAPSGLVGDGGGGASAELGEPQGSGAGRHREEAVGRLEGRPED